MYHSGEHSPEWEDARQAEAASRVASEKARLAAREAALQEYYHDPEYMVLRAEADAALAARKAARGRDVRAARAEEQAAYQRLLAHESAAYEEREKRFPLFG